MEALVNALSEGNILAVVIPLIFKAVIVILIWILGRKLIQYIKKLIVKVVTPKLEPGVAGFLQSLAGILLNLVLIFAIVEYLGFPAASLATVLASAGLAVGLAAYEWNIQGENSCQDQLERFTSNCIGEIKWDKQ